ncbi:metallo-peptidase, Clan MP, Family M67 [Leishmania mexicana MHOM/GT/2001/U1103]|uniref:Metallopeptidase n=1 Tax=Leishmania mexicana (strain MHOM/GT/2001/U1103) TaxID=929439 RepID=E9AYM4_LEIMU|nr:metallo-peptidase, Clan MP, Family M67 [Leishmania mexicana MHOM/GT/2001/U1103]CBZ28066.1 metallo-peptidase, Clan MP, Family M67 [Leishmania mexicana MHOM/GT/2001/U1103]
MNVADMSNTSVKPCESRLPLSEVRISDQVVQSCLRHAFTTEGEEVMGLLLGRIEVQPSTEMHMDGSRDAGLPASQADGAVNGVCSSGNGTAVITAGAAPATRSSAAKREKVAYIWGTHIGERNVQRSDRVEMSAESVASATEAADRMTTDTGALTYVVGWYHSHPRIPAVPSSVDLCTQGRFQQYMESGWVGLIASVFNTEASITCGHCTLHCFQAGLSNEHVEVPMRIVPQSDLFASLDPIGALTDTTPRLLQALQKEVRDAVAATVRESARDAATSRAARGLAEVQLFQIDRLVAEPTRKELAHCSLPLLRAEVARLEAALAETARAAPPPQH